MISYERISFPGRQESQKSKDFPRRAGLYAEVASQFTPSIKGCEAAWLETSEPYANHTTLSENIVKISNVF